VPFAEALSSADSIDELKLISKSDFFDFFLTT
jgi:hypothetical protein